MTSWIDIQNPTPDDLRALREKYGIHEVILRELEVPSIRSHVEFYDDYFYFVYNFPIYNVFEQTSRRAEIDFIVTKDAVITTHYEPVEPLSSLQGIEAQNTFELVYHIFKQMFRFEERQLRHIREKVEFVGTQLFKEKEKEVLQKLSLLKRDISEYRIIVRSAESILNSLRDRGTSWWGEETRVYLNELGGEHLKIVSQVEDYRGAVDDFEQTNSQLLNAKTTEVMKTLTGLSFLTFPFVLFVTVFAMDVHGNPLLELQNGFWFILGGVVVGIISLAIYFRKRGWI